METGEQGLREIREPFGGGRHRLLDFPVEVFGMMFGMVRRSHQSGSRVAMTGGPSGSRTTHHTAG
jgi:hypothetical protein